LLQSSSRTPQERTVIKLNLDTLYLVAIAALLAFTMLPGF